MIQKTFSIILLIFMVTGSGLFFVVPEAMAQFKNTPPQLQVKKDGSQTLINRFEDPKPTKCPPGYPAPYDQGEQCVAITWIADYIVALYRWLVSIVGILAVAMGVWAGIKWMAAAGNPEQINSAKTQIMNAVIGILLLLGSYVFLNTINPELTKLKGVIIPGVIKVNLGGGICKADVQGQKSCGGWKSVGTGTICSYRGVPHARGSNEYTACCAVQSSTNATNLDCCLANDNAGCKNQDETCVQVGDASFDCIKGYIAGSVTCDAKVYAKNVQLYAVCKDSNNAISSLQLISSTGTYTGLQGQGISSCDEGTRRQTYSLVTTEESFEKLNTFRKECLMATKTPYAFLSVLVETSGTPDFLPSFLTLHGPTWVISKITDLFNATAYWFAMGKGATGTLAEAFERTSLKGATTNALQKADKDMVINQDNITNLFKDIANPNFFNIEDINQRLRVDVKLR